ncbi:hypothetical protein QWA68_010878 [Fusarium oxysporum]|nr:hypothetical protein QWA68_010878 [Fusarium oxysporum]
MPWFKKDPNRPAFVLLESAVPFKSKARLLLGSVVADIRNPTDDFEPDGKSETAFRDYILNALDTDYSAFFKGNDAHNLSTKVGHLAGVSSDSSSEISTNIKSSVVRTKSLMQHYKVFEQLISSEAKSDIITLMKRNDRKAFLVVGLKSVLDASHVQKFSTEESLNVNIKVPVGKGAEAASHGTVHLGDTVNPEINYTNSSGQKVEVESTMTGERIFAIRYRLITLSRNKPNYGDVVRVKFGTGVFGDKKETEVVFDEGDEEEAQGRDPVVMSNTDEISLSQRYFEDDIGLLGLENELEVVY